jgi:predicted CoA-binding protein
MESIHVKHSSLNAVNLSIMSKRTIVLGASIHSDRYSNRAVIQLKKYGHEVIAIGNREGEIDGVKIHVDKPSLKGIDTISLYLNPGHQQEWYSYILSIHPRRILFNPGAENPELSKMAAAHGIQVDESCTLVLLSTGQY